MTNLSKLLEDVKANLIFIMISLVIMIVIFGIAKVSEILIDKKLGNENQKTKVHKITSIAMLSAMAVVLMLFEFPLPLAPSFYKMDISEVPVVIGAFMFGPVAGVAIEAIKVLLHLVIKGTSTAFVGDFANFLLGSLFVLPASVVYILKKTRKNAIIGLSLGTIVLILAGCLLNAYFLLPKFAELYGIPMEYLIAAGTAINPAIKDVFSFVALAVAPFNIVKGVLVSIITIVIYKYISRLIKNS